MLVNGKLAKHPGSPSENIVRVFRLDAPKYGTFTCDTEACSAYVKAVEARSKKITDILQARANEIHVQGDKHPWDAEKRADFQDFHHNWIDLYRVPWEKRLKTASEDCDSFLPGPCKRAIDDAEKHEAEVIETVKRYEKATGAKTGLTDNPKKKKSANADDKKGSLFSLDFSGFAPTLVVAGLVAGGVWYATRK